MGIISSKLAPVAVRLAWICQTLLDPRYSCIESIEDSSNNKAHAVQMELSSQSHSSTTQQKQQQQQQQQQQQHQPPASQSEASVAAAPERISRAAARLAAAKSNSLPPTLAKRSPDYSNSLHQENRNRRAAQLRFKTRPSSFDAALIVRGGKNSVIVANPTPSSLRRQQNMRVWDMTSSSGCSSDSASNSDSDSETELRVSENVSNEEGGTRLMMSAEEEEIFRLTVGRGHFSRSKKDRFLNHLRLEKRLNDLSNEYFGIACKSHHRGALQRRHSGELHRII